MLTEEDLNNLNYDVYNVYSDEHIKKDRPIPATGENYRLRNGTELYVVDTKDDSKTGFQGMAVAPIVNGKPDYDQITVVAAGTDPDKKTTDVWSAVFNGKAPFHGDGQLGEAEKFVSNVNSVEGQTVVQLSGYSQSAYMLEVGGKLGIPTTVFNGWFLNYTLSPEAQKFIKENPYLFVNYRHNKDLITFINDFNSSLINGEDFGTTVWVDGSSHNIRDWKFDKDGRLIVDGDDKEQTEVRLAQIQNQAALALYSLYLLKSKLTASGGGLSANEELYLDSEEARIYIEKAAADFQTATEAIVKVYQEGIEEAEGLWQSTLSEARSKGSLLEDWEISDVLDMMNCTEKTIATEPSEKYQKKIDKINKMSESFTNLIAEIKAKIDEVVQQDSDLAQQIAGA